MDETRSKSDRIRDGAFSVLLNEGLTGLSLDRVAKSAGVSRQLVRYYFPGDDDLMIAICDHLTELYRDLLIRNVVGRADGDRLRIFFDFYFDLLDGTAKPRDDQVYDALFSLAAGSPAIREHLRGQYTLLGQALAHEIRTCHQTIPMKSCSEIAYLFVAIMYGHWKMVASLGLSKDHRQVSRQAINRLIGSYLANPGPVADVKVWGRDPKA